MPSHPLAARKAATRIADIPPDVLAALNSGRLATISLAEWLAVDHVQLLEHVIGDVGLDEPAALRARVAALAGEGITRRLKGVGEALHQVLADHPEAETLRARLDQHPSDVVRAWSAYAIAANPHLRLPERLSRLRAYAMDESMAVRECAWDAWRPWVAQDLARGLKLLRPWVAHRHEGVRRCAVEGTRPRGVWTRHIAPLKHDPARALPLLEPLRADPSRYVQNAVANWLNDASKDRPDFVMALTERWLAESDSDATRYIVRRATRTLRRAAN